MTETVPDGPTNPNLADEESTTVVTQPGYGGPPPAAPPVPPPTAVPATERVAGGRVYATGEPRPGTPGLADRGRTTITDEVVERVIWKIVDLTADEVNGVHGVYRGVAGEAGAAAGTAAGAGAGTAAGDRAPDAAGGGGSDAPGGGVSVRLDGYQAVIDVAIEVEFGHAVHEVVETVRASIISQAERLLGVTVTEVNVLVAGVALDAREH